MNIQSRILILFLLTVIVNYLSGQESDPVKYVDPFIGTGGHGHTFPGATAPFGMVQLSPDTRLTGWDGCSGYHYSDSIIYGFSHTHLSGTGVSDYGDILIMPSTGFPYLEDYYYKSTFKKENEVAEAGYYSVLLDDKGIKAELTTTERVGMHRYTFPANETSFFVVDLAHRDKVIESRLEFISSTEIRGMRRSTAWADDQVVYFHMMFSKPIEEFSFYTNGSWAKRDNNIIEEKDIKAYLAFSTEENEEILIKVGISFVDERGAYQNLYTEIPDWDFDAVREENREKWNKELLKIKVKDTSQVQKQIFYTALYHCMIAPNLITDVDQRYLGMDKEIHSAMGRTQYTVFSLWDTFRALHPLLAVIDRRRTGDFIQTFLRQYQQGGLLPVWELAANETYCMIGYHSVSVILDAYVKGIRDFDTELALEAMLHSASRDHFGLDEYRENCFIPGDKEHESVSKTLEYAYDDWCIGQFAKLTGKQNIYEEYMKRAQYYKNIFDPQTGFMRPKINGGWKVPFSPGEVDLHFTEANSWQYSFFVPHDIKGLFELHLTGSGLESKLDELFETDEVLTGRNQVDITGLIGQYAHGNEPSHHMAYLYNYVGKPWKTQYRVRQILKEQYHAAPDGLSGNEDCGQMSAWYVWSAIGMYPVCPGSDYYVIGTPLFDEVTLEIGNNRTFTVKAENQSAENLYIQSATLNDVPFTNTFLTHEQLKRGGVLKLIMGKQPNENYGSQMKDWPVSEIETEKIVTVPYFSTSAKSFRDSMVVEIKSVDPFNTIYYQPEHSDDNSEWVKYDEPIVIKEDAMLRAVSYNRWGMASCEVTAHYKKHPTDYKIILKSPYSSMYTGGGADGLMDGIRGSHNWKMGGWQGLQGDDFEAIIDLGKKKRIKSAGAGFCQDIRSWIWLPTQVEYYVSNDGEKFKHIITTTHQVGRDDYTIQTHDIVAKIGKRARYLKVIARNLGTTPDWHLSPGEPTWLFIDEIWME